MQLKPLKSFQISKDSFDISILINEFHLDNIQTFELIEKYRRVYGNDACSDTVKLCSYILDNSMALHLNHTRMVGSTLKIDLYSPLQNNKILFTIEGGVIQFIQAERPVDVLSLDFDIEGIDPEDLLYINDGICYATMQPVDTKKEDIETVRKCHFLYEEKNHE